MEQYEFTTPNGTKFTVTSEEVSNGWLTQVEVYKYAWVSPSTNVQRTSRHRKR